MLWQINLYFCIGDVLFAASGSGIASVWRWKHRRFGGTEVLQQDPGAERSGGLGAKMPEARYTNCSCQIHSPDTYSVSQKKSPLRDPDIFIFFHKRLRIFNRFFTHLLYVLIHARLQIFIQLSRILTKLCHIMRDYPVHIICSRCPQSAETHALTRLRKSLIALLIVVCGK